MTKETFINSIKDESVKEKLMENTHLVDKITVPFETIKKMNVSRIGGKPFIVLYLINNEEIYID